MYAGGSRWVDLLLLQTNCQSPVPVADFPERLLQPLDAKGGIENFPATEFLATAPRRLKQLLSAMQHLHEAFIIPGTTEWT